MFNENEVTLTDDLISNICLKGELSQLDTMKEDFLISLLEREFSGLD